MARLNKHGAELVRVKKTSPVSAEFADLWSEKVIEKAYMSDGEILQKRQFRNARTGKLEPGDWKLLGKVKPGLTPRQVADLHIEKGWTLVHLTPLSTDKAIRSSSKQTSLANEAQLSLVEN